MQRIPKTAIGLVIAIYLVTIAGCTMLDDHGGDLGNNSTADPGSEASAAPSNKTDSSRDTVRFQTDTFDLQGTIVHKDLEGGFFAIDGDDGKTYDPINLPESFKKNGMRVKAILRVKKDVGGIHMVGETVEIVDIVESKTQARPTEEKENLSNAPKEFQTTTGKTIIVSETHPKGRSLSSIAINTRDFEHNFKEVYEDQDPISDSFLADLDGNGFDELYIITTATGSGSYGSVIGLASNKDKSLSRIHFPPVEKDDEHFIGYMGHDTFKIDNRKLVRLFPIYNEGDTNQEPTGGTRKLTYGLFPGEATWQLKVTTSETLD